MMDALAEDYNLENRSELSFVVVENSDPFITETISNAFEEYIADRIDLHLMISGIINKISTDEKLLVKEYGVNFEGLTATWLTRPCR